MVKIVGGRTVEPFFLSFRVVVPAKANRVEKKIKERGEPSNIVSRRSVIMRWYFFTTENVIVKKGIL